MHLLPPWKMQHTKPVSEDTIIIKAPVGTKARWVKQSQKEGKKLSDWILERMDMANRTTALVIPADLDFSDLKMARAADGDVSFDWAPIERICTASGVDVDVFKLGHEDNLGGLLTTWYRAHLSQGGQPDPIYADLIGEVQAEDAAGQRWSHAPGRA